MPDADHSTMNLTTDEPSYARTLATIAIAGAAIAAVATLLLALRDQRQSEHDLKRPPATLMTQPGSTIPPAEMTLNTHTVQPSPSRR